MNKYLYLMAAVCFFIACKPGSAPGEGNGNNESLEGLVDDFPEMNLPYSVSDTLWKTKANDTASFDPVWFGKMVQDSTLSPLTNTKARVLPVGKFRNEDAETYLVYRVTGGPNSLNVVAIDENYTPKSTMQLMVEKGDAANVNQVNIDGNLMFYLIENYRRPDGSSGSYSAGYAYNTAGMFMEIMNNGLRKGEKKEIINPIDTLPETQKFSGDYGTDDRNFISVRDGVSEEEFVFFINMDKPGECSGEVKGEARWITEDSAFFSSTTDACALGFKFKGSRITISEVEGCGNQRPISCSFDATYTKKKAKKTGGA